MADASDLRALEFVDIAHWRPGDQPGHLAYSPDVVREDQFMALTSASSALYAFVCDDVVMYIGKTARTIRARFMGYRFPGRGQATNIRCNQNIRDALAAGKNVQILVLVPTTNLQWGSFSLDLAAGLEESLIRHFQPPWNGKGRMATESAELEETATRPGGGQAAQTFAEGARVFFSITLHPTYLDRGLLNLGAEASGLLGAHGALLNIRLGDETTVASTINRTANRNGSVRVVGSNAAIADFFQRNFQLGAVVKGAVIDGSTIALFGLLVSSSRTSRGDW